MWFSDILGQISGLPYLRRCPLEFCDMYLISKGFQCLLKCNMNFGWKQICTSRWYVSTGYWDFHLCDKYLGYWELGLYKCMQITLKLAEGSFSPLAGGFHVVSCWTMMEVTTVRIFWLSSSQWFLRCFTACSNCRCRTSSCFASDLVPFIWGLARFWKGKLIWPSEFRYKVFSVSWSIFGPNLWWLSIFLGPKQS